MDLLSILNDKIVKGVKILKLSSVDKYGEDSRFIFNYAISSIPDEYIKSLYKSKDNYYVEYIEAQIIPPIVEACTGEYFNELSERLSIRLNTIKINSSENSLHVVLDYIQGPLDIYLDLLLPELQVQVISYIKTFKVLNEFKKFRNYFIFQIPVTYLRLIQLNFPEYYQDILTIENLDNQKYIQDYMGTYLRLLKFQKHNLDLRDQRIFIPGTPILIKKISLYWNAPIWYNKLGIIGNKLLKKARSFNIKWLNDATTALSTVIHLGYASILDFSFIYAPRAPIARINRYMTLERVQPLIHNGAFTFWLIINEPKIIPVNERELYVITEIINEIEQKFKLNDGTLLQEYIDLHLELKSLVEVFPPNRMSEDGTVSISEKLEKIK